MTINDTWASWAEEHLRRNWRTAVQGALDKVASAKWHPNGFIVFRLGEVQAGAFTGSHRVHIWPGGMRRRVMPGHPTIHSHDWELQSLVLSGKYEDVIFSTSTQAPALHAHAVQYDGAEGDSISPTGGTLQLIRQELRAVKHGASHHMDVGVPHETLVPEQETVVTYVMMGPQQADGMMLASPVPFSATRIKRPLLAPDEQLFATQTLQRLLSVQ